MTTDIYISVIVKLFSQLLSVPQSVSSLFSYISLVYVVCYSDSSSVSILFSSISLVYAVCYCYALIL